MGYADVRISSANAEYDPTTKGFALTFAIEEGPRYRFGDIAVISNVPGLEGEKLRPFVLVKGGAVFDGNALDKSSEVLAIEMSKLGYPFAQALPRTLGNPDSGRMDVAFVINQGPRTYIERIDIHGNTKTRDYVIRREFDIAEGDAYNKTLVDRAERRLKNLNYFKTVKISNRPGTTPDHIILDVEAIDQATGDFFVSGGYSTVDGALVEVKVSERNFYGTGKTVQAAFTLGQYGRGIDLAASEPQRSRPGSSCSPAKPTPAATNPTAAPPMVGRCSWARPSPSNSACNGATRSTTRMSRWRRTAQA